ncbi:hypothetical protein HYDPIDRAFT_105604 [Hydnomerulius pinastri MD-312]|nr:hypothetical protein HYDPIDRAFT_105604 [Hydnomerulius pinastri MD-312]
MSSAQGITDSNLQAAWQTYCLSFASTSIIIWDHVVTIDQEVEYFWSGELDISRVLYLSIRYLALGLAALSIYVHCYVPSESTIHTIDRSLYAGYILAFVIILLCQGRPRPFITHC